MDKSKKRNQSPMIRRILALDVKLTKAFVQCMDKILFMKNLKSYYRALEISCHGVFWLVSLLALIWILNSRSLYQMQVNLIIALILDIIVIGVIKASTRRRRPAVNDDPLAIGPDKFSFPSGHASRSMLLFYFFKYLWPVSDIYLALLLAWIFAIALSRILMRRHHMLDIIIGLFVGYIEGIVMSFLYLNDQTCVNIISWMTKDKMDGTDDEI